MIERVTTIALNIETRTPMIRTRAKPRIAEDPREYRIVAVMSDDTLESRIEFQARLFGLRDEEFVAVTAPRQTRRALRADV